MEMTYHAGYHLPAHRTILAGATGEGVLSHSHGLHRWSVMLSGLWWGKGLGQSSQ